MARRARTGLATIPSSTALQHGMSFVVRWTNPAIGNKKAMWLGIHVPPETAPRRFMTRPKETAKADTPEAERAYMLYLPGRNSYAWIDRKNLFLLSAYPPETFESDGHECASLYRRLYTLMQQEKDLEFWIRMAKKEREVKGMNGKHPSLVMPSDSDSDEGHSYKIEEDNSLLSFRDLPPAKKARKEAINQPAEASTNSQELVKIYLYKEIYFFTRQRVSNSLLRDLVSGNPPFIFHPYLLDMTPEEFESVQGYIMKDEDLDSDFINVGENQDHSLSDDDDDFILGDIQRLGKTYTLKGIKSVDDLNELIIQLMKLHKHASNLKFHEMSDSVIKKLQVAWNVYCGAPQLPLFLDFIKNAMVYVTLLPFKQTKWIVEFLAHTMMLYRYPDSMQWVALMQKYPGLQSKVMAHRAEMCNNQFMSLATIESEFMQKAPLLEARSTCDEQQKEQVAAEVTGVPEAAEFAKVDEVGEIGEVDEIDEAVAKTLAKAE